MTYEIEKKDWHICKLCDSKIQDLAKLYGGGNIYFTQVFEQHLIREHKIDKIEYFSKLMTRPICECGKCGKLTKIGKRGARFFWKKLACGLNIGVVKWSEKAKIDRVGKGNPMYGKESWNKGLTKETSSIIKEISDNMMGRTYSNETLNKMSEAAKSRLIHGHTGCLHSEYSKELMRQKTLQRIHNGDFKQTKTKPHIEMGNILKDLNMGYEEEVIVSNWTFDYFIPKYNIYIEVDGDYFHSNPLIYNNGPETKTQKRNHYRDKVKNHFCKINNISLYRFWESDILKNKERVKCLLKELFI